MVEIEEVQQVLPEGIQVRRQIHDGGQRKVYEADDGGTRVVIKLMSADDRNRAEREVAIGRTFDHPNLPQILDEDVHEAEIGGNGFVWFREAFIEGETLAARDGRYEPCQALVLAADLVSAVQYLWNRHNVVHRDIKPLNILCRLDGGYVLIDVGIGRHQGQTSITSGVLGPGTEGHIAPEQLIPNKSRSLDARTDLFLIGIVIFQVLTDVRPFRLEDSEYHAKLLSGDWPRPQGLPPSIATLLERFLARHPHQRPTIAQAATMVSEARKELECS